MTDSDLAKFLAEQKAENQKERTLNRIEARASSYGIREDSLDDARNYFSRRAEKEDLSGIAVPALYADLKASKPRFFDEAQEAAATTATAQKENAGKNHADSTPAEFSSFVKQFAGGLRA